MEDEPARAGLYWTAPATLCKPQRADDRLPEALSGGSRPATTRPPKASSASSSSPPLDGCALSTRPGCCPHKTLASVSLTVQSYKTRPKRDPKWHPTPYVRFWTMFDPVRMTFSRMKPLLTGTIPHETPQPSPARPDDARRAPRRIMPPASARACLAAAAGAGRAICGHRISCLQYPSDQCHYATPTHGETHNEARSDSRAPRCAEDNAHARAEEAVARVLRDEAAVLQSPSPRKPAGLPHPGTRLQRLEAGGGEAVGGAG